MYIASQTLGCKLNQLETESIIAAFLDAGWQTCNWEEKADFYLINSCTVTSMAEQKARRLVRVALRGESKAPVLITGCYAQLDADEIQRRIAPLSPERFFIWPGDKKAALLRLPKALKVMSLEQGNLADILRYLDTDPATNTRFSFAPTHFEEHSRAFLKIQDGCDNHCSFCRVRLARGKSSSLASTEVLKRLQALEAAGFNEVVLTGINLQSYNDSQSLGGLKYRLPELLTFLLENTEHIAIRISSSEIDGFNKAYAKAIASPRIRPHFHLSVQSGSDTILKKMRRRYTRKDIYNAVELLRSTKNDPFIACDIIAGFPGESEEDFQQTLDLCRELDLASIHAFPFSPRAGTEAVNLRPYIPERIAKERVGILRAESRRGRHDYALRSLGKVYTGIVERIEIKAGGGDLLVLGENYLRCKVPFFGGLSPAERRKSLRYRADTLYSLKERGKRALADIIGSLISTD